MIPVLVVCDDLWHPAEVVEMGLAPLKGDRFHFQFVKTAKDILTPERIAGYPVILACKGDAVSASNPNPWFEAGVTEVCPGEFEDYIRAGGGFLSVHAFNTAKAGDARAELVGNHFLGHPPRCDVDVRVTGKHPVTEGVTDFRVRDEHYRIEVTAKDATELMRTTSEKGGEQVGGYVREMGKGRLCVLTPGHTVDVWYHEMFQRLLTNAIAWCAGRG